MQSLFWPNPDFAHRAWGRAVAAYRSGQPASAEGLARLALVLHPGHFEALHLLGVLVAAGRPEMALRLVLSAARLHGGIAEVTVNLGCLLYRRGRIDEAVVVFRRALALGPENQAVHVWLGLGLLALGQFAGGWAEFEWRFMKPQPWMPAELAVLPLWSGEALGQRPLLLHYEQGMGDILQFCRFLPLVTAGARVVLQVHRPLKRLLAALPGVERVIAHDEPPPPEAVRLPVMSLGRVLALTPDSVPARAYLSADPAAVARWAGRLPGDGGVRVGLVWAGNPQHPRDRQRSLPFPLAQRLLGLPGITWYSLQVGPRAGDIAGGPPLVDLAPELTDFADTAAALSALDLLVSVDTAVVHLAGALGRPAWVMLSHVADWRWGLTGETTPWYPSLRLFRQPREGDWEAVIDQVAGALEDFFTARTPEPTHEGP
ncbi:MAG TPA: tetratricopeptide repeat protein [Rhodospirillaceae bacterium]|nr:tetratricopeptide repeat protein [Rhodospirillaceae bacterium]